MNMPQQWMTYRVNMATIFTAPFSGVGYFIANSDDFIAVRMTKLGSSGEKLSDDELILNAPYTR